MENKDQIRKELEELSPFLSGMKKEKEGFDVPVNYFKQLPDAIMDRIKEEEAPSYSTAPKSNWLEQIIAQIQLVLQPQYALALASVAILVVAGLFLMRSDNDLSSTTASLAEVSDEEIASYVMNNVEEFEMDLLIEVIDEETLDNQIQEDQPSEEFYMDDILEDLSDEELEELM